MGLARESSPFEIQSEGHRIPCGQITQPWSQIFENLGLNKFRRRNLGPCDSIVSRNCVRSLGVYAVFVDWRTLFLTHSP